MKKKDILFLQQFFYPEYNSSATLPFDTAVRLAGEGYSVDVMCGYPYEYSENDDVPKKETVNNVNIRRIKYTRMDKKKKIGRLINYLSLTVAMFMRFFSMRAYKTIIVYSNPPILPLVAAWASKVFGCKLVFVAYDLYPEIAVRTDVISETGLIAKMMRYVNKNVYRQASAVVALSSEMKEYIVKNRKIAEEKVVIIPNWYEDEYTEAEDISKNAFYSVVKDRFAVGYFGNMGIAQNMEPIKDAMKYYKNDSDICFILAGHGAKHQEMMNLVEKEKIDNAYVYGFLKGQDYLDALKISNCAIISLEKDLTGLCSPSKTYGCMMQGLPIVAIMDESDVVRDARLGAGCHVSGDLSKNLIDLIGEMKADIPGCRKKGEVSRQIYLENYTPDICLNKYVELMKKIS